MALYDNAKLKFEPACWTLVSCTGAPLQNNREIVRACPCNSDDYENEFRKYLELYIDATNAAPSSTITDPWVNQKAEPGLWRLVNVGYNRDVGKWSQHVMETLREGWATAVLTADPVTFTDEADLIDGAIVDVKQSQRTVEWTNVAQTAMEACALSLRTQAVFVDPVASGQTLTGTWLVLAAMPSAAEDGSGVVRAKLQKCRTGTSTASGGAATFDESLGDEVKEIEYPRGLSNRRGLVRVFYYRDLAAKDALVALGDTSVEPAVVGGAANQDVTRTENGASVVYKTISNSIENHGGGIYTVTQQLMAPGNKVETAKHIVSANALGTVSQASGDNLTAAEAVAYILTGAADGHELTGSLEKKPDGTYSASVRDSVGNYIHIDAAYVEHSKSTVVRRWKFSNASSLPKVEVTDEPGLGVVTDGRPKYYGRLDYQINGENNFDGELTIITYLDANIIYSGATGLEEVELQTKDGATEGTTRHRTITSTYDFDFKNNPSDAYLYISGGLNGSSVNKFNSDFWIAKKVTKIEITAWSSPETSISLEV